MKTYLLDVLKIGELTAKAFTAVFPVLMLISCGGGSGGGSGGDFSVDPPPTPPAPPTGSTTPSSGGEGSGSVSDSEPNDDIANSQNTSPPFTVSGTVNDSIDRYDMYRFTASASGEASIYLDNYGANDLDLSLRDDNQFLAGSASATDPNESINWQVTAGETYYITVIAFSTAQADSGYSLSVTYIGDFMPAPTQPPSQNSYMTFEIVDGCNDGYAIDYKFYDVDNNRVWPSSTTHYSSQYYNRTESYNLACIEGAKICYGGRTGNTYWGVDVDKSKSCDDCCYVCTYGATVGRTLVCR